MAQKTSTQTTTVNADIGKATGSSTTVFTIQRFIEQDTVTMTSREIYPVRGDIVDANTAYGYTDVAI